MTDDPSMTKQSEAEPKRCPDCDSGHKSISKVVDYRGVNLDVPAYCRHPWHSPAPDAGAKKCAKCGKPMAETQVRCIYCDEFTPLPKAPAPAPDAGAKEICDCYSCRLARGAFPYMDGKHDICTKAPAPAEGGFKQLVNVRPDPARETRRFPNELSLQGSDPAGVAPAVPSEAQVSPITPAERAEQDRIDKYLTKYNLWLDDDARTDLIMLCNSFYEEGLALARTSEEGK